MAGAVAEAADSENSAVAVAGAEDPEVDGSTGGDSVEADGRSAGMADDVEGIAGVAEADDVEGGGVAVPAVVGSTGATGVGRSAPRLTRV